MDTQAKQHQIFFSFFMFTADLKPEDRNYTQTLINHLKALTKIGYTGFDMHIASPSIPVDHCIEVENYAGLKNAFNDAGFEK